MMGRDHTLDPSPKTASITELENWPSRAGDIALQHQKTETIDQRVRIR